MPPSHRRAILTGLAASGAFLASGPRAQETPRAQESRAPAFRFEDVARRARAIAGAPFEAEPPPLPDALARLDAAGLAALRFRPERALLGSGGGPFRMQLFHAGLAGRRTAQVNVVRDGVPIPVPYQAELFETAAALLERLPINLGFAGLRLHAPLNDPRGQDEVAAFLGPAEFRVLGRGDRYGLAARALLAEAGVEVDETQMREYWREYWVELPGEGADAVTLHALVDGPAAAGALRLRVVPGEATSVEVRVALYPRQPIARVGLAPLLSTYRRGEEGTRPPDDHRPEVHDSDGLLLATGGGEWLWRPLRQPREARVSAFLDRDPRGFGLLQRDRRFESYQDLAGAYERRPGYWIEPDGPWGEGQVTLVEGSAVAGRRNVLASWQPRETYEPGREIALGYRLRTVGAAPLHPGGRCVNTFEAAPEGGGRRFLVDFAGGDLAFHLADPGAVEVVAGATVGRVAARVEPNPPVGGFRAVIELRPEAGARAGDLRAYLRARGRALTETWTLPWPA